MQFVNCRVISLPPTLIYRQKAIYNATAIYRSLYNFESSLKVVSIIIYNHLQLNVNEPPFCSKR